jgi:CheY-like chemotaxis protein
MYENRAMSQSKPFTNTRPFSKTRASGGGAPSVMDKRDFQIAGVIGGEMAVPLASMQSVMDEINSTQQVTTTHIESLTAAVETARILAQQSQQLARLDTGRIRQSHERLSVSDLLNQVLDARQPLMLWRGVELYRSIKPVEVIVDAGLLSSLVEVAVDWAMGLGQRMVVSLTIKNWPEHAVLMIKTFNSESRPIPVKGTPSREDRLSWYLLMHMGQAMGVSIDRVISDEEAVVMIEFPRTVKHLEGLTAVEMDAGGESAFHNDSKPLAGHRILVITADSMLRESVKSVCKNMGLVLDSVASMQLALRFCEMEDPQLVIFDERARNEELDVLQQNLQEHNPDFPFIEITGKSNTLEIGGWMSGSMARVSRDSLQNQLGPALVLELMKVV